MRICTLLWVQACVRKGVGVHTRGGLHLTRRARGTAIWRHPRGRCCGAIWICSLAPGTSADVFVWDRERPQRAKGYFKDYEVGANCIMLLTVLCLWEGGAFVQFLWPKR